MEWQSLLVELGNFKVKDSGVETNVGAQASSVVISNLVIGPADLVR